VQTKANLIENMRHKSETIERFAQQAYPIIHQSLVGLIQDFLSLKLNHGSSIERDFYKEMTLPDFVDRLVSKRPLVFYTPVDSWIAKDGSYGTGGWQDIGTEKEGSKGLKLESFLSYDEIKISALVQLSTPTVLINNGNRDNIGRPAQTGTFTEEAVYVAAVGARFEVAGRMEYQDMILDSQQNLERNGYGETSGSQGDNIQAVFAKFYGRHHLPLYQEVKLNQQRYVHTKRSLSSGLYLDKDLYTRRIQISAETFLIEADSRGLQEDREVYCHVVGLGLGVWQISSEQNKLFLRAWINALEQLRLERVKNVNFSYISPHCEAGELEDGQRFPATEVLINFSRRSPFDLLTGEDQGKLVVAMFAWDGNSYVGNEYWDGLLSASGDPAAACCSNIPELLNPEVNSKVRGDNLRVATRDRGLLPYTESEIYN